MNDFHWPLKSLNKNITIENTMLIYRYRLENRTGSILSKWTEGLQVHSLLVTINATNRAKITGFMFSQCHVSQHQSTYEKVREYTKINYCWDRSHNPNIAKCPTWLIAPLEWWKLKSVLSICRTLLYLDFVAQWTVENTQWHNRFTFDTQIFWIHIFCYTNKCLHNWWVNWGHLESSMISGAPKHFQLVKCANTFIWAVYHF